MKGWINDIQCEGHETRLEVCKHGLWNHYNCPNGYDNTVKCGKAHSFHFLTEVELGADH